MNTDSSIPSPAPLPVRSMLPDSIKRPLLLLWVSVIPQLVLLLINIRAHWLVSGELESGQKQAWACIFAFEVFMVVAALGVALGLRAFGKNIPWSANLGILGVPVIYLWYFILNFERLIPRSVASFILPTNQLLYFQFVFIMPVIFYATVRIACFDTRMRVSKEILFAVGAIIGPPVFWFGVTQMFRFVSVDFEWLWPFIFITGIITTVILFVGLVRACLGLYLVVSRTKSPVAHRIFLFLVGFAAPIGGLILNAKIPFPFDFQSWPVYAMAAVNGILLALPKSRRPFLRRFVWLLQCALFSFTLYFFLVFLPFLPLSLPALIAAGAGFLILTPPVLFLVHLQHILHGFQAERRAKGSLVPAFLGVAAFLVIPLFFAGQALVDRIVLRNAIAYIYEPDYGSVEDHFGGSRIALRRSLERLRDFKAGLYLPFISDFYDWAVFGNLILPDEKMNAISRAFFDKDIDPPKTDTFGLLSSGTPERGRVRREFHSMTDWQGEVIVSKVVLSGTTVQTRKDGACERRTLTLQMRNMGDRVDEFSTTFHIPDGVLVSGFWLKIGDEKVPGRIFEKKTAMWVYQMIRDSSSRDPGILIYSSPNSVEMRVFPLASRETREVEIEFLYPAGLDPAITIGNQPASATSAPASLTLASTAPGSGVAVITPAMLPQLPVAGRTPYLHFIIDRSKGQDLTGDQITGAIRATAGRFPAAKMCAITFSNYESVTLQNGKGWEQPVSLIPIGSIDAGMIRAGDSLPVRGGFLPGRAIKRALVGYHETLVAEEGRIDSDVFPLIVIITKKSLGVSDFDQLSWFEKFAPDAGCLYTTSDGEKLLAFDFAGKPDGDMAHPVRPVALLKFDGALAACPVDAKQAQVLSFEKGNAPGTGLSVLTGKDSFRALTPAVTLGPDDHYSRGLCAWQQYLDWVYNPSLGNAGLAGIVRLSREAGILTAATSFIVVENSSQWKILKLKEDQKLANQSALEFTETPEPSTWALLLTGMAIFYYVRRKRDRLRG